MSRVRLLPGAYAELPPDVADRAARDGVAEQAAAPDDVVVCMPVRDLNTARIVEGSEQRPCTYCQAPVWLSPVTVRSGARVCCVVCMLDGAGRRS